MVMDNKTIRKSRKEKRKGARTAKTQQKFQSWLDHQKSRNLKKNSGNSKFKNAYNKKNPSPKSLEKRRAPKTNGECGRDLRWEKSILENKSDANLDSSGDEKSALSILVKPRKMGLKRSSKTKFERYLEMNKQESSVLAEEDMELERRLAKKLKVKEGKLRGEDDGVNLFFEGISSVFDSFEEDEFVDAEESDVNKSSQDSSSIKKQKKRKSFEQGLVGEMDSDVEGGLFELMEAHDSVVSSEEETAIVSSLKRRKKSKQGSEDGAVKEAGLRVSEPGETSGADVALEEVLIQKPALEGSVKYVPRNIRSRTRNKSDEVSQFRRRVRCVLNHVSESKVESITGEVSTIFRSVPRSVASQIISTLVLDSSGMARANEQCAAVYAAFVAGMGCLVGIDFSANFIASLAKSFEKEYADQNDLSLENLTLLLSYLCVFGVCSSDLIYDFLITLNKRLLEIDVSTILRVLQYCGMKLRSDDPTSMKDFFLRVQNRVNELKASSEDGEGKIYNKRMGFMLQAICDIKNNKKRAKEDPAQHTRIKKWLQKLKLEDNLIRGLTWSKLLDPDKKGQWWLSGDTTSITVNVDEVASTIDREVLEAQKMLHLATTQKMNTDARKAIFCVIMSGEDYIDGFEKLLRLDLHGKQDREIMRVLVDCCLQEKVFNKYYTVLASKFCNHNKNHKFTLQYCLWDHFKELESMQLIRSMHLARFVAEMLASFSLSLAVLKIVEFSDARQLTPKRIIHFRMLFEAIFEYSDALVWNIFTRVAVTPELESLRNGIEFFIKEYIVGTNKAAAKKFKVAKKALNNVEGVLM